MEGSGPAKARKMVRDHAKELLQRAGLPPQACAAWVKTQPRSTGNYKRDCAAGSKYWRGGAGLLAKLPKKIQTDGRTANGGERHSCRLPARARRFSSSPRRDGLSQADQKSWQLPARRRAGLRRRKAGARPDADAQAGRCRKRIAARRERRRRSRSGNFPVARARPRRHRHASVPGDAHAQDGSHRARRGIHGQGCDRFRPGESRAAGQGGGASPSRTRAFSMPRTTTRSTTPRPPPISPFSIR